MQQSMVTKKKRAGKSECKKKNTTNQNKQKHQRNSMLGDDVKMTSNTSDVRMM